MSSKGKSSAEAGGRAGLVPKLRFPEFQAAPGWEYKRLASFLRDSSGRAPSTTTLPVFSSTREGLRRQDAYFDGRILQNNNDYGVVPPGCFVYRHMSDDGTFKFNINDTGGEIAVSKEYPVFETVGLDSKFLLELLNEGDEFKHFAFSQKAGGTRTRLYFSKLCEWRTRLPTLPEQQKIAECLDSADALAAAQGRKVETLTAHKKGLMQQLFPQEGETKPRLRFPEFEGAGEWEVRTIGEMFSLINGCAFKPEDWKTSGTPIIRIQNLNDPSAEFNYSQEPVPERKRVEPGDLLFAWSGTLGSSFGARIWNGPSGVLNQHIFKVLMDEQQVKLQFALLVLARVEEEIARRTHGFKASFVHVKKSDLVKVEMLLPSPREQQRIADCLSSLDDLIAAEVRKLDTLKTHKKGLMQQLFPQVSEAGA
ncbi:restriction endonuclease subunit S [Mesorhizobium sp. WSM4887]|uniref:restriction endonuclease subunit S n=1 Tax=Mesorhizobium sp. WSM4887 TaxID=3038543 RepID=UPI002416B240|nr:restriction endonuclease subunit S [Mesorhizobium sp. WSM4887]MDG4889714.1 restriction endonuclease subunit S [Mesorhizobium sp. WSM4887]